MASTTNKSTRGGGNSIHLQASSTTSSSSSPPTISCSSNSSINSGDINNELPKTFIAAMRTLFDIMADGNTGFVRFSDIEQRWREGSDGMPRGVIDSLRKVTPPNGLLSFDRFCEGLKICLLRNQNETKTLVGRKVIGESNHTVITKLSDSRRPPSAPLLDLPGPKQWPPPAATVRPISVISMPAHRTLSMPQLSPERDTTPTTTTTNGPTGHISGDPKAGHHNIYALGPPKPPRSMRLSAPAVPDRLDKAEIRNALQNWQLGVLEGSKKKTNDFPAVPQGSPRGAGDGQTDNNNPGSIYQKKTTATNRRREPRRHTLQNGVDYNMLKRLKQIEQEKDVLLQGLAAVESARDWYLKQVAAVQEKIKYLGRTGNTMELWTDAQQERLDLQRARILEVNRHLMTLYDSDNFPMHMNLALRHHLQYKLQPPPSQEVVNRLKQQNQQLSDEVVQKNDKVAILEREKATLIHDIIQLQQQQQQQQQQQRGGRTNGHVDNIF